MKMMLSSVLERATLLYARRFPIRRGKLRVINFLSQASSLGAPIERMTTLKYGGYKMSCDLSEMIQKQFYYFGTYFLEEENIRCWQSIARRSLTILGVGANAGIYSLAALAVQPRATVHAFEPTPEIAKKLRETAALNALNHLYVHEAAVSAQDGTAILNRYRGELGTNGGMNFISETSSGADGEKVQTVSLDQFCTHHSIDRIDLLKIDIQGNEYAALQGAQQLIQSGRIKTIFMELNWDKRPQNTCPATHSVQFLQRFDYRFSKVGRRLIWRPAGDWLRKIKDVIATICHDEGIKV